MALDTEFDRVFIALREQTDTEEEHNNVLLVPGNSEGEVNARTVEILEDRFNVDDVDIDSVTAVDTVNFPSDSDFVDFSVYEVHATTTGGLP